MVFPDNIQNAPRIFTWHVHGSYLYYLSQGNYEIYLPVNEEKSEGYGGRGNIPFGKNVHEIPARNVKDLTFDCILFQSSRNYAIDQYEILSPEQRELPRIYLEHDPPRKQPTDTRHVMDDPDGILVHVTHFNKLMWDNNCSLVKVIEHGVMVPPVHYTGVLHKGVVVINDLAKRGRRLGADIFAEVQKYIPLDLIGMHSEELGGLGEIPHQELPAFLSCYRFFFNPIRYTSLGLSVCEAMMLGLPVVGLATTELPTVIDNEVSGYTHTDIYYLIEKMERLLQDQELAARIGAAGKETAEKRFNIGRFAREWEQLFHLAIAGNKIYT